jgi:uncharacterized membrane protein
MKNENSVFEKLKSIHFQSQKRISELNEKLNNLRNELIQLDEILLNKRENNRKNKDDELDYKDLQNQVAGFLQKQRKVLINI